jgi:HNH endonuclease
LLKPLSFDKQLTILSDAIRSAVAGDLENAKIQLGSVRSDDLRAWCKDYGEKAGNRRYEHFGRKTAGAVGAKDIKKRPDRSLLEKLFARDGYRCRYCGVRVIPDWILELFSDVVGPSVFSGRGSKEQRHGAAVTFRAVDDHVIPHALGGQTDLKNLVTACWPCNFGKWKYTLEQIGIYDPRKRRPRRTSHWDGLVSLKPKLRGELNKIRKRSPRIDTTGLKGPGGVSIALWELWIEEWEQNGNKRPSDWKMSRENFFLKYVQTIRALRDPNKKT